MKRKNTMAAIWLIGLGILFLTGDIWPGILILIGLSLIVSAYIRDEQTRETPPPAVPAVPEAQIENEPVASAAEESLPEVLAPEAERLYLVSQLPEKCPACDAPLKSNAANLEWHEDKSFSCQFCGFRVQV